MVVTALVAGCHSLPSEPASGAVGTAAPRASTTSAAPVDSRVAKVAVMGDSVMLSFRPVVRAALRELRDGGQRFQVVTGAALGFGLGADRPSRYRGASLPPMHPGYQHRWRDFLDRERPDEVLLMVGTWDAVVREVGGRWLGPGAPGWSQWYARRVDDAVRVLTGTGARLTWLAQPCVGNQYPAGAVNAVIAARLAARHPGVPFVDLTPAVCDGSDPRHVLPGRDGAAVRVRRADRVHFAPAAASVLGPVLAEALWDAWSR